MELDLIYEEFLIPKEKFYQSLLTHPLNLLDLLPRDLHCQYQMEHSRECYKHHYSLMKKYQCQSCRMLEWVEHQAPGSFVVMSLPLPSNPIISPKKYLSSSSLHNLVVSWILEMLNFPVFPICYSFICYYQLYWVLEGDGKLLSHLKLPPSGVTLLLDQLLKSLNNKEAVFINHYITPKSLIFINGNEEEYDPMSWILYFQGFTKCDLFYRSMTFESTTSINRVSLRPVTKHDKPYFMVNCPEKVECKNDKKYYHPYHFYAYLLIFVSVPSISSYILEYPWWKEIWLPDERDLIISRLQNITVETNLGEMLNGLHLLPDVIERVGSHINKEIDDMIKELPTDKTV